MISPSLLPLSLSLSLCLCVCGSFHSVLGWDVKQFTNDRFGLTWWAIACLSFAYKQYETFGYVSDAMLVSSA